MFAAQERDAKRNKLGDVLQVLDKNIYFVALAAEVDRAAPRPDRSRGSRPPFLTEVMVRILLLQQLFNLSDEQMEFQLLDRMSFLRFHSLGRHQRDSRPHDYPDVQGAIDQKPTQADPQGRYYICWCSLYRCV